VAVSGHQWLSLCRDKSPGEGEDAPPIARLYETRSDAALLGVFDGLGGAGGRINETENGERHSSAYFAARIARSVSLTYFRDILPQLFDKAFEPQIFVNDLQEVLFAALQRHAHELRSSPSRLRSSIISTLPTTTALAFLETDPVEELLRGLAIWSGDSRVFVLTPAYGLSQVTVDDLRAGGDAFENLAQDSPMSNYASADRPFHLNYREFTISLPGIVLAATDGCYHYLPSPMHWEYLLLDTLSRAGDTVGWSVEIEQALAPVAGDDVSLALVATGWDSFAALKHDFGDRLTYLRERYIEPLDRVSPRSGVENGYGQLSRQLWGRYKHTYEWGWAEDGSRGVNR